jgi:hypothetical protein
MSIAQTVENRYNGQVRYLRRNYGLGHAHIVNGEKKVGVTTITGQFEKAGQSAIRSANLAAEEAIAPLDDENGTSTGLPRYIPKPDSSTFKSVTKPPTVEKPIKPKTLDSEVPEAIDHLP